MQSGLSSTLKRVVTSRFDAALANKHLTLSETELTVLRIAGLPFQLRYSPTLGKKPQQQAGTLEADRKKVDPFDDPDPELLVTELPPQNPTHFLVLNKFPIIPRHFILATRANKPQTHFLEEDDLVAAFACLTAWSKSAEPGRTASRLFAFFNSGEHSGASQQHRHIQFIPVEDLLRDAVDKEWSLLADNIMSGPANNEDGELSWFRSHHGLPFKHFATRLPRNCSPAVLDQVYHNLYEAAVKAVRDYIEYDPASLKLHSTEGGDLAISYNLAITTSYMILCPRQRGGTTIRRGDGTEIGTVELNGTLLAGTFMVKNEEMYKLLREEPDRLEGVLEATGIPTVMARIRSRTNLTAMNNL